MWFLNKRTGVKWDVDAVTVKRLSASPDFEPCEPPEEATAQVPGGSVLHTELSGLDMPAQPPGSTSNSPSTTPQTSMSHESSTDDASDNKVTSRKPDPSTGATPKRARKVSRRNGV